MTETPDQGSDVQSDEGVLDANSIIAPYLEGVPSEVQTVVAEKLEAFRKDADRNANKKIQQQAEQLKSYEALGEADELELVLNIWQNLIADPVDTIEWLAERFSEEQDRDLKADLLKHFGAAVDMAEETTSKDNTVDTLTKADVERMLEDLTEKLEKKSQEEAEYAEYVTQTEAWIKAAATNNNLQLDEQDEEIIVRRATALIEDGVVDNGKDAIDMATEAFANRIRELAKMNQKSPKIAEGGQPVNIAEDFDLDSASGRKAAAEAILKAAQTT